MATSSSGSSFSIGDISRNTIVCTERDDIYMHVVLYNVPCNTWHVSPICICVCMCMYVCMCEHAYVYIVHTIKYV